MGPWIQNSVLVVLIGVLSPAPGIAGGEAKPSESSDLSPEVTRERTAVAPAAGALEDVLQELDERMGRLSIHGHGFWAYGITDRYAYRTGGPEGEFANLDFALAVSSRLSNRVAVFAQPDIEMEDGAVRAGIDYVFGSFYIADALEIRAGSIKQPFGIYTEVFDVATLRPFLVPPTSIYGNTGMIAEGYYGVGFSGRFLSSSGLQLGYDIYGGELGLDDLEELGDTAGVEDEGGHTHDDLHVVHNFVGGRLVLQTPIPSLRLGASAYTGSEGDDARHSVVGGHVEWVSERLWARGEYVRLMHGEEVDAAYLELAYFVVDAVQLAVRGDWTQVADSPVLDEDVAPSLLRHLDLAAGISLWASPELIFRVNYHRVRDNRFAHPGPERLAAMLAALSPGEKLELKPVTQLLTVGAAFSF